MFEHMKIPEQCRPALIFRERTISFGWVWCDGGRLPLASTVEVWAERHITKYVCCGSHKGVDTLAFTGPGPGSVIQEAAAYGTTDDVRRIKAIENEKALKAFTEWPAP